MSTGNEQSDNLTRVKTEVQIENRVRCAQTGQSSSKRRLQNTREEKHHDSGAYDAVKLGELKNTLNTLSTEMIKTVTIALQHKQPRIR